MTEPKRLARIAGALYLLYVRPGAWIVGTLVAFLCPEAGRRHHRRRLHQPNRPRLARGWWAGATLMSVLNEDLNSMRLEVFLEEWGLRL